MGDINKGMAETSNVNDIETKGQTFRYRSLLSEWKQNVLFWSPYYRNESKTFWIGLEIVLGKGRTFLFSPKTNRSKRKVLIWFAYYWNKSKTFWFGLLSVGTKAKHFDLVKKSFLATRSFPFLLKNSGTEQSSLIWSGSCLRQIRTFIFNPKT